MPLSRLGQIGPVRHGLYALYAAHSHYRGHNLTVEPLEWSGSATKPASATRGLPIPEWMAPLKAATKG